MLRQPLPGNRPEKPLSSEKPMIPERPSNINIKRASVKLNEKFDSVDGVEQVTFKTPLTKSNSVQPSEKPALTSFGNPAVLERTKVYKIETEVGNVKSIPPALVLTENDKENSENINCKFIQNEVNDNGSAMTTSLKADSSATTNSPSSPRNFDVKGEKPKRPHEPPPAAPANRPKSNDSSSTNL
jgi:hypothetical protein